MKNSFLSLIIFLLIFSCKKSDISTPANLIVGKWQPTNELQTLLPNGNWGEWTNPSTYQSLPTYEFTKNGKFLLNNEINETCCNPGSNYRIADSNLTFEYDKVPDCRTVKCADANSKTIELLDKKYLILVESSGRFKIKYKRVN